MAAASELYGYDEDQCIHAALRAYEKTLELLAQARDRGVPQREIIKQQAAERIDHEQHPVVKAARQYGVDISRDFASWVTDRWLPGITGVGGESFAHHAVALFEAARGRGS